MKYCTSTICFLLVLFFSSCSSEPETSDPSVVAANNESDIQSWLATNAIDATRTNSGLYYSIVEEGKSTPSPQEGDEITIDYDSFFTDGNVLYSSRQVGRSTTVPVNNLVPGLQEGVKFLTVGSRGLFLVPAALGFDDPQSTEDDDRVIIYEIQLVDINDEYKASCEQDLIRQYMSENDLVADTVTDSGLHIIRINTGNGEQPSPNSTVVVHYEGKLLNGTVFDSSVDGTPATFNLNGLIAGWREGIQLMSKGERSIMIIPSEQGYGRNATGNIPSNSVLIFEIELIDFTE